MVFKEAAFLIELPHTLISLAAWYFEGIPQLNSAVNLMYKPRYLDRNVLETESLTTEDGVYYLKLLY